MYPSFSYASKNTRFNFLFYLRKSLYLHSTTFECKYKNSLFSFFILLSPLLLSRNILYVKHFCFFILVTTFFYRHLLNIAKSNIITLFALSLRKPFQKLYLVQKNKDRAEKPTNVSNSIPVSRTLWISVLFVQARLDCLRIILLFFLVLL